MSPPTCTHCGTPLTGPDAWICPRCDGPPDALVDVVVMSPFGWWEQDGLLGSTTVADLVRRYQQEYPAARGHLLAYRHPTAESVAMSETLEDIAVYGAVVLTLATVTP